MDVLKGLFDIEPSLLFGIFIFSVVTLIGSTLLLPHLILKIPPDYFVNHRPLVKRDATALFKTLLRNSVGCFLLCIGILLLFLPGQGILTIIASLFICDFPGKRKTLRRLIHTLKLEAPLNRFRIKHGRAPFLGL